LKKLFLLKMVKSQTNENTEKADTIGSKPHLSYIDRLEMEILPQNSTSNNQNQAIEEPAFVQSPNAVLCYLNIFDNGNYTLEKMLIVIRYIKQALFKVMKMDTSYNFMIMVMLIKFTFTLY